MPKMRTLCILGNLAITSTSSTMRFSPRGCLLQLAAHVSALAATESSTPANFVSHTMALRADRWITSQQRLPGENFQEWRHC